jgi:ribonuclease P protein component
LFCPAAARRVASASRSDGGGADRTFSRASRLRTRKLFLDVYDRGLRVNGAYFVLFGVPGATPSSRLGITATKKFGHAVARNRVRRIVRDVFRNSRVDSDRPCDLVVNVKISARGQSHDRLAADLIAGVRELRRKLRR